MCMNISTSSTERQLSNPEKELRSRAEMAQHTMDHCSSMLLQRHAAVSQVLVSCMKRVQEAGELYSAFHQCAESQHRG